VHFAVTVPADAPRAGNAEKCRRISRIIRRISSAKSGNAKIFTKFERKRH